MILGNDLAGGKVFLSPIVSSESDSYVQNDVQAVSLCFSKPLLELVFKHKGLTLWGLWVI